MRFLLSSADGEVVEAMGKKLNDAGIGCEIRYRPAVGEGVDTASYKELWVTPKNDLQWAISLLALHCEVGRN